MKDKKMIRIKILKPKNCCVAIVLLFLVAGCQPKVYLMPTPAALQTGEHDPFARNPELEETNRVVVAYATNRMGVGPEDDRKYITLFDGYLRLGTAQIRIGSVNKTWKDIYSLSTSRERQSDIRLDLEAAKELAELNSAAPIDELSPEARLFFEGLNEALDRSLDKDLILYVHGANNNFYRASAQAAQFHHFTGRNSVVLFYAWPSAESFLRYAVDVNNAGRTVPIFSRLLELLGRYTKARHIDILAYSAGAQVVSPALALLRENHASENIGELKQQLRLGEVYFAAPDVDFKVFLENLATYIDLPQNVTLTVNPDDTVLALAAMHHNVSRAGSPDPDELSAEETRWVIDASRKMPLDILWITAETIPDMSSGSHSFWYSHPWVSTDVLIQFLFQARPAERGLVPYEEADGVRLWYFPADYPEQSSQAINRLKEERR
jgi:esterase/lipase superfamily enzyme